MMIGLCAKQPVISRQRLRNIVYIYITAEHTL